MGHYLKANKTSRTPSTFITFDTETEATDIPRMPKSKLHLFKLGWARSFRLENGEMTRRKEYEFQDLPYFWHWVVSHLSKHRPTWMFAHNAGFDMTVTRLWELIEGGSFDVRRYVDENPPVICSLMHERGKLVILDSMNWFRTSLETIGKDIGIEKIPVNFADCSTEQLSNHCRRDVEILEYRIYSLLKWLKENDLGVMQKTAPSQAMQCYRHRFAPRTTVQRVRKGRDGQYRKEDVTVCYPLMHDNPDQARKERMSYFGGEARCFWIGKVLDPDAVATVSYMKKGKLPPRHRLGPIYHLDVNSLYPFVMQRHKYPCKYLQSVTNIQPSELLSEMSAKEAIAIISLHSPIESFPIRLLTKPVYACGKFWTSLCGEELRYALRCGFVKRVSEAHFYSIMDLFSPFVTYFCDKRQQYQSVNDRSSERLCKLILNSLQGKFGAKAYKWVDRSSGIAPKPWGRYVIEEPWGGKVTQYRSIGYHVQEKQEDGEARDAFVPIPAIVCANGRQYMRELRGIAEIGGVLYQHTDSLHVTQDAFDRLERRGYIHPSDIGKLKIVEVIRSGEYRDVNNYTANGSNIVSGLKGGSEPIEERVYATAKFASIARVVAGKPPVGIHVSQEEFEIPVGNPIGRVSEFGTVYPMRLG